MATISHRGARTARGVSFLDTRLYTGFLFGVALLISGAALGVSHQLTLTAPVVILLAFLLALPALVAYLAPAVGVAVVLLASLISWAVPALIPHLSALSPGTVFGVALLTGWVGLLGRALRRRERLLATPLLVPLLLWDAWGLVSLAWNWHAVAHDHSALFQVLLRFDTAFLLYAANALRTEQAIRRVLLTLVFSSVPLSLIAYLQYGARYLGIDYAGISAGLEALAGHLSYNVRVAGTLPDATIFSFYYLVVFVLAAMFLSVGRGRGLRIALLLTVAFDVWPFLMTFTKSTLVVTLLALLVLAWMRRDWRLATGAVLVAVAGWLALTLIPFSAFLSNLGTQAISKGVADGGDVHDRLAIANVCAKAIPSHALFGAGPLGSVSIAGTHCHSLPLEVLVDFGLLGAAFFGWVLWRIASRSWHALSVPGTPFLGALAQANLALLLAFALLALLWPFINFLLPWYWVVIAIVVGGSFYQSGANRPQSAAPPASENQVAMLSGMVDTTI